MRLKRPGITMMMNRRQAAMMAAQMRHPAGKAIPPSAEVQSWQQKYQMVGGRQGLRSDAALVANRLRPGVAP